MMTTIQIPQGKTSMTLPDGRVIQFPEGATTVDIPDNLLSQAKEPMAIDKIQAEEQNANPFINQEPQGYNTQVHPIDMEAINKANEPKSFLDTVKDFGTNVLKNFTQPVKEVALPIASVTEELTNTFLPESMQTDIIPDLPSKIKENPNKKTVDTDTLQAIENLSRTDIRLFGEATQEQKDKYTNDLAKVVNLGGYNLVQTNNGEYKAQNEKGEILDLNAGFYDSMLRGLAADQYEIAGDLAGGALASTIPGGPVKKIIATAGGAMLGGMIGNQIDNLVNGLETGQLLSLTDNLNEASKAGVLSSVGSIGGHVVGKALGDGIDAVKYVKDNGVPIGEEKLAQKYIDENININTPENIQSKEIAKEFGADSTKLNTLSSADNTQKALSDMFENDMTMRETILKDHEKLVNNVYADANVIKPINNNVENQKDTIGGLIDEQVKSIDKVYKNVFSQTKDDIVEVLGDRAVKVDSKTADIVKKKINTLDIGENIAGETKQLSKNELDTTFSDILDIAKNAFTDTNGNYIDKFKISKMMDLNKELNQYARLHEDKLTPEHFSVIKDIRNAINEDITKYADITLNQKDASIVKDKWKEINSGYSQWLKDLGKNKNKLNELLKDNANIKTLMDDMVAGGTIKNEYLETFGDISQHLRKTNPNALSDFHDTVFNAILQPITVKQKLNGKTFEFIDFDMFEKMFDENNISTRGLNKIFTNSKEGAKKLETLKKLRVLSKDESSLQRAIYKNQSPLSEAAQKAVETKRTFLFGVKYFFTRTLVNAMASHLIPSVAFDKMVIDLAKKQRYGLNDLNNTIRSIEKMPEYKRFTPDEKIYLKNLRVDAENFENDLALKTKQELELKDAQTQKELFEKIKQEADQKIKDNMLLEWNYKIPPQQIKDGAKSPLGLDIQDRINVANTKQPSTKTIENKPTTFDEFTQKAGIDKKEIISKVELENKFNKIKQSPYYQEVLDNAEVTYAKDTQNKFTKDGETRFEKANYYGQGNENGYNKIDATYSNNDKFGTVLTKQDFNKIQSGKIDEELVSKLETEIIEREQANILAKQEFEKEFAQADKNGKIPFSHPIATGGAVGVGDTVVNQRDYNQDGKVDEMDIAIGALIGSIGLQATMKLVPHFFKMSGKNMTETGIAGAAVAGTVYNNNQQQ